MALNPPLTMNGDPCRVEGEFFVMKRKGVEFEFKVENGSKYTGEGSVILTTARMVCINKKTNSLFKAFDIPLAFITNEKFEQPIFGANYIKGTVKPLFNLLPGNTNFKIWFSEGGFGTFVPGVFNLISSIKKNNYKGLDNKLLNSISTGTFSKTAYVDPNDPSIIYLEQPEIPNSNTNQNNNQGFNQQQPSNQGFNQQQQFNQGFNQQQQFNQGFNQPQQFNQGFSQQPQQQQYNQGSQNNQIINPNPYNQGTNQILPNNQVGQNQLYNQQYTNQQQIGLQQNLNQNTSQNQYPNYNQQYSNQNFNQQQQSGNNYNPQFINQNNNQGFSNQNQVSYDMIPMTQPIQVNSGSNMTTTTQPIQLNNNNNNNFSTMTSTNPPHVINNQSNQVNYPDLNANQQQQQQPLIQQQQPQQPSNPKYFGFFGPELKKNN